MAAADPPRGGKKKGPYPAGRLGRAPVTAADASRVSAAQPTPVEEGWVLTSLSQSHKSLNG